MNTPSHILGFGFRRTGIFATAVLAASLVATPNAVAASTSPRVYPSTPDYWVGGVTSVTFHAAPGEDMSAVTSLTLIVDGEEVGTDTAAPWSIDWDTTRFHGDVLLSTRATTATQSRTTVGHYVTIDNTAPSKPTVGFPRMDGYIGRGGTLTVNATDNHEVSSAELVVGGDVVSSNSNLTTGRLDLRWDVTVPNGKTDMTVRVRDRAGNVTALTRPVIVDNDRPVITGRTSAGSAVHGIFKVSLTGYRDASPLMEFQGSISTSKHVHAYVEKASRTVTIDSRDVPDGKYMIGWHAIDAAGNAGSVKRALIVDNKNPTVSIAKAPKNKATLAKTFKVTAKASDLNGITKVQLLINGEVVKTDTTVGYTFTVNPKKYGKKFTVRVRAYDKAGNVKYSSTRTYKRG
jgi:archaellum component FlaF (FlaF/FlaG flagellin family)